MENVESAILTRVGDKEDVNDMSAFWFGINDNSY